MMRGRKREPPYKRFFFDCRRKFLCYIRAKRILDSRLIVRNERDTCLIQVRLDKQGEPYYIIPENVSWDFIKVPLPKWELVKKYSSLYYGTLALRSRESRETLQQILQQGKFAHVLCDVNLRPPFYSAETVEFCLQHCDRAKLNEEELDKVCALFSLEGQSLKDKMRAVMVRFSLEALIVTLGKNGAAYLDQAGFGISPGIPTSVKDPVGAGDGFCAGLLVSLERGCSLEEACGLGNQLGAYIASKTSSIPFYTQEEFLSWRSCHV